MTPTSETLIVIALAAQIVLLVNIRIMLLNHDSRQRGRSDQAHQDVTDTAAALKTADAKRQTDDAKSGESVVNTRVKP